MTIEHTIKAADDFLKAAHKRSDDERRAMFADLAAKGKIRRTKSKPTTKGKGINTKKDNSSIGRDKPKEKYTMINEKLPVTKDEIIAQLKKQKVRGLKDTALFLTGVGKQGVWNEQPVSKEYMMKIRPHIIDILDDLKAKELT